MEDLRALHFRSGRNAAASQARNWHRRKQPIYLCQAANSPRNITQSVCCHGDQNRPRSLFEARAPKETARLATPRQPLRRNSQKRPLKFSHLTPALPSGFRCMTSTATERKHDVHYRSGLHQRASARLEAREHRTRPRQHGCRGRNHCRSRSSLGVAIDRPQGRYSLKPAPSWMRSA